MFVLNHDILHIFLHFFNFFTFGDFNFLLKLIHTKHIFLELFWQLRQSKNVLQHGPHQINLHKKHNWFMKLKLSYYYTWAYFLLYSILWAYFIVSSSIWASFIVLWAYFRTGTCPQRDPLAPRARDTGTGRRPGCTGSASRSETKIPLLTCVLIRLYWFRAGLWIRIRIHFLSWIQEGKIWGENRKSKENGRLNVVKLHCL